MKGKSSIFVILLLGFLVGAGLMYFLETPEPISLQINEAVAITDREYFDVVHEALQSAKTSIHMVQFELNYYNSTKYKDSNLNILVEDLIAAAKNGVEIKVIVDEYDPDANRVINMLREAGVTAKFDSPKTTTHDKLIIIDGETVIVGSTNWSHFALDKNHEANVMIKSKSLASEFEDYFNELWKES